MTIKPKPPRCHGASCPTGAWADAALHERATHGAPRCTCAERVAHDWAPKVDEPPLYLCRVCGVRGLRKLGWAPWSASADDRERSRRIEPVSEHGEKRYADVNARMARARMREEGIP